MDNREADFYFHQGTNFYSYDYLGCNRVNKEDYTYSFRTWAPNADSVALISEFSGWDAPISLKRITDGGIYELIYKSEHSIEGKKYKYRIFSGEISRNKGDPYARYSAGGDDGASIVYTESCFSFNDYNWLKYRRKFFSERGEGYLSLPINIYEVHLGSLLRHDRRYYNYRELADFLAPYSKAMGYTHVEILPIQEYPFDGSWGYQPCAFFAPTSRFGTPDDFKYFVNKLHSVGVGVIMDWVGAHFPKDEWGLYEFDGYPLYEYQGKDRMESAGWGTRFFDLGREEIQSFLISNALYYLREFHIDGLRVDAVASMIYLDYDKRGGEWIPNETGTNENLEAVAFLKKLNSRILDEFPDVMMIAEESGSRGEITAPLSEGGLGFGMKWNMGFANDLYKYLETDPIFRKYKHSALNFPLLYAYNENYCLPISHDEVVHGKKSFIDKQFGDYEDKFSSCRAALLYLMTFPGKKLTFMGCEFAQFREWDYDSELEWFMLKYDKHREFRLFVAELNNFYLKSAELWELDFSPEGFSWILPDESDKNTVAYKRISKSGRALTVLISFSGATQEILIPLPENGYRCVFDTLGGIAGEDLIFYTESECGITLPPLCGVVLEEINEYEKIETDIGDDYEL